MNQTIIVEENTTKTSIPWIQQAVKEEIFCHLRGLETEHDIEFVQELVDIFESYFQALVNSFDQIIQKKEMKELIFNAHKLKSAAQNLGALKLAEICDFLENHCSGEHFRESASEPVTNLICWDRIQRNVELLKKEYYNTQLMCRSFLEIKKSS